MRTPHGVLLAALCTLACSPGATETADEIVTRARQLAEQGSCREALPELERALDVYRRTGDAHGEAVVLGHLGNCWHRLGDDSRALEVLQCSLAMKRELRDRLEEAKTLNTLGLVYWSQAEYRQAADHLGRSLAIAQELGELELEGAVLNNLGLVRDEKGDYRRSLELYQEALSIFRDLDEARGQSHALGNIGGVHLLLGRFNEALGSYRQAFEISERHELKYEAAVDLGNLGLCYLGLGQTEEALATLDRALVLSRALGARKEETDWRMGRGAARRRLGRYEQALEEYEAALEAYEETGHRRELVAALQELGGLHLALGDAVAGERTLRRASDLASSIHHPRGVTVSLLSLGDLEWRRQRYEVAASLYRQAYERATTAGDRVNAAASSLRTALIHRSQSRFGQARDEARRAREAARQAGARLHEAQALLLLGEVARKRGKSEDALGHYAEAESIARETGAPELGWRVAHARGRALAALGRHEQAAAAHTRSVEIIEAVRQQLLEERWHAGYIDRRYHPYLALSRLLLEMGRTRDALRVSEKLRARTYLDFLTGADERSRPGELRAFPLDDVRASLPAGTAVVEYLIGENDLLVFGLTRQGLWGRAVPVDPGTLQAKVELFRDLVARGRGSDWRRPAESLYRLLIEPLNEAGRLSETERLVLIPHGVLHYLPFAALARPSRDRPRFLVEDYTVSYTLSIAALTARQNRQPAGLRHPLLVLAPRRSRLEHAQREARTIAGLFEEKLLLVEERATESAFKDRASLSRIIHLATHGYFNKLDPLRSGLELEADPSQDGRLEVREILGLRLAADLVVLSACETALGSGYFAEAPAGDDFVGLTHAFLHAGSRSVLASLWEVDDKSTARLMRDFYRHLERTGKAAALAAAQRAMLGDERYAHPRFWAPFVLVGR